MSKTWVLVADSKKARLFEFERCREPWTETACFMSPDTIQGATSERPPRVHESMGHSRHAIEPHTDGKEKAAARFASTLVATLRTGQEEQRFKALVLVAAPRFLGALHKHMDKTLQQCVNQEIRHNLIGLDSADLRGYLLR